MDHIGTSRNGSDNSRIGSDMTMYVETGASGCRKPPNGRRRIGRRIALFVLYAVSIQLLVGSCREEAGDGGTAAVYEIDRNYRRGPVSFRVAIDRKEITIAERVTMLLEARAEEGYQVELPRFGEKLQQFGIVDYRNPQPELEEGGVVVTRRTYELEPFLSGDYRVPPMALTFWQEGDTMLHRLESDTLTVRVRSIIPGDEVDLAIRDIAGPVSYPKNYATLYIIAGCVAAAVAAVFFLRRFRRRREEAARRVPAHEIAYMRLERLLAGGMLDEKRYREFTAAVSDILRYYIEDRFGLRAPERTTEEFLLEAGAGLPVNAEQKDLLKLFLVHCDLVKFAALEPSAEDVKRTFETCRDFIDTTKREEEVSRAA
ncbi:MAG TPA: hypothetical protein VMX58_07135 [Patescibacteria group bacterium]|nr:hypothetical protein [Patescibacteria group bacterium]